MTENNLELFDDEHAEIAQLADKLDLIPSDELRGKWPQFLADLIDVLSAELQRQKIANADIVASKIIVTIAHFFGGRALYLPTGDAIKTALRDYAIFDDWGRLRGDVSALMDKYGITQSHMYAILRQQSALRRRRHQIELFNDEDQKNV